MRNDINRALALLAVAAGAPLLRAQPAAGADAAAQEARWLRNVRQITREDMGIHRAGEAYFSADMRRICFQAYPQGQDAYQIYTLNLDGSDLQLVSTGQGATTCAYFHPDGRRMLFASNHLDPRPAIMPEEVRQRVEKSAQPAASKYTWPFPPGMDIFELRFGEKELRRLTTADGYDAEASYSPDGRWIVFTSMRDGDQEIYIGSVDGDADKGGLRRITHVKGYDGGPFFSPDGKRIVYRSDRNGDGNMQIFVNNLEGTDERALTGNDVLHWCPYWHPSGKWLIFTRADHGTADAPRRPNYDLYLLAADEQTVAAAPKGGDFSAGAAARADADGKLPAPIRITFDDTFDGLPVFSPDGKYVMWTSKRGGLSSPQVFIAEFVGLSRDGALTAGE